MDQNRSGHKTQNERSLETEQYRKNPSSRVPVRTGPHPLLLTGSAGGSDEGVRRRLAASAKAVGEQRDDPERPRKLRPADRGRRGGFPPLAGLSPALSSDRSQLPQGKATLTCSKEHVSLL